MRYATRVRRHVSGGGAGVGVGVGVSMDEGNVTIGTADEGETRFAHEECSGGHDGRKYIQATMGKKTNETAARRDATRSGSDLELGRETDGPTQGDAPAAATPQPRVPARQMRPVSMERDAEDVDRNTCAETLPRSDPSSCPVMHAWQVATRVDQWLRLAARRARRNASMLRSTALGLEPRTEHEMDAQRSNRCRVSTVS